METWVMGIILTWLAIISWFDLNKREVPHTAWVVVPLACAMVYQAVVGGWPLTFLSVIVALTSERERLAKLTELRLDTIFFWVPFLFAGVYVAGSHNPIGAIAIVSFWVAWELRCWGGADAVTSIALALIWPDARLIVAILIVHAFVAGIATLVSLIKERRFRVHQLPGLPLLFLSALLRFIYFS